MTKGQTAALSFVTSIASTVLALVIAQMIIESWKDRRALAPLPKPPVDGFDQT